jgi:hypothetical protein
MHYTKKKTEKNEMRKQELLPSSQMKLGSENSDSENLKKDQTVNKKKYINKKMVRNDKMTRN